MMPWNPWPNSQELGPYICFKTQAHYIYHTICMKSNCKSSKCITEYKFFLHFYEIVEGLYFYYSLFVCMSVCVSVSEQNFRFLSSISMELTLALKCKHPINTKRYLVQLSRLILIPIYQPSFVKICVKLSEKYSLL